MVGGRNMPVGFAAFGDHYLGIKIFVAQKYARVTKIRFFFAPPKG
jgi:hypothetical protein